jgi:hypothetical protein
MKISSKYVVSAPYYTGTSDKKQAENENKIGIYRSVHFVGRLAVSRPTQNP